MRKGAAPVSASAPGKIILFGEHAVVYGEPAIGVPLGRRVEVTLAPGRGRIRVAVSGEVSRVRSANAASPRSLVEAALEGRLELLDVRITIGFPPMAGLGSSAALAVALLRARDRLLGVRMPARPSRAMLEEAIAIENVAHGTSSGLDPAICLWDQPIYFQRAPERPARIRPARIGRPVRLIVGSAGTHGGTRGAVGGIAELNREAPRLVGAMTRALGALSRAGAAALEAGDLILAGRAMDLAHGLLSGFGLVSERVEHAVRLAREHGALGAKMSGAGGRGGALIALAGDSRRAARIQRALTAAGVIAWIELFER